MSGEKLPFPGGYTSDGVLTDDAGEIRKSGLPVPMGFWKGSGLAIMIDLMTAILSGGAATHHLLGPRDVYGPSQVFIAFSVDRLGSVSYAERIVEEVVDFIHSAAPIDEKSGVFYPGERTLATRRENMEKGIPVDEDIWKEILTM